MGRRMVIPLPTVIVRGNGARFVEERGSLNVYRKWVEILSRKHLRDGRLVAVEDEEGNLLGCGFYDGVGPVALRIIEIGKCSYSSEEEAITALIERAYNARKRSKLVYEGSGYRLVNSDGDWLPGIIIDVYDDVAVIQSSSIVWDKNLEKILYALREITEVKHVYEKSTQRTRRDIGLEPRERLLLGTKTRTVIQEEDIQFIVDIRKGQKTGFFLDQRSNRIEFGKLAYGEVLDLFAYTGGFGLHALLRGDVKRVVFVEEDKNAVELLKENLELNKIGRDAEIVVDNVWNFLKKRNIEKKFDSIAVDPPAFIQEPSNKDRGRKAYETLYALSLKAATQGSLVFLSSCSSHLTPTEFEEIISNAILQLKREAIILGGLRKLPSDHTVRPLTPYLDYLKAFFMYVM